MFLVFDLVSLVLGAVVFRAALPMQVFGLLVYGVIVFFLFREPAKAYFAGTYEVSPALQHRRRVITELRFQQRNQSDLKRLFGIFFAAGAGFFLVLIMFMSAFTQGLVYAVVLIIFGIPVLIAFGIGVVLWGRTRWMGLSGWTLAVAGGSCAFIGLITSIMVRTDLWEAAMAQSGLGDEIDPWAFVTLSLLGLCVGLVGGALLYRQHEKDQAAADRVIGRDVPGETL